MTTILVIEDDAFIRESICDILTVEGYQILMANNGLNGVNIAIDQLPDLILCDVAMPHMDGYEVLQALQQHHATHAIPFIFLTARTAKADLRQGMDLGADDYLLKPCTALDLLKAINRRLEKQSRLKTHSEEQLNLLRSNIAKFLPHELYTPLNGILGFSELLMRDCETIERAEIREVAKDIYSSALRLHHLMQNFLLYSKLEIITYHPEQLQQLHDHRLVNPKATIHAAAEQTASSMQRLSDLQINCSRAASHSGVTVQINDLYLQKIVTELISNACKFSEPDTPIELESDLQADQFILTITNQGRGMTADQIASLGAYMQFDRNYYEQQGSGLGLIISKRIAELHGGSLQIKSTPGTLTRVQVQVPVVWS
jgi:signal transduction histidine kinase